MLSTTARWLVLSWLVCAPTVALAAAGTPDTITDVKPDGTVVGTQTGPMQLYGIALPDGPKRDEAVAYIRKLLLNQAVTVVDKGAHGDSHEFEVNFQYTGHQYPIEWALVSRGLATARPGTPYVVSTPAAVAVAAPQHAAQSADVVHIHGHCTVSDCDAVGLFEGGSATTPYKTATVDANGDYSIDVDLKKDLHPMSDGPGGFMADLRFFKNGAFEESHGRCNFLIYAPAAHQLELQVYEGPTLPIKNNDLEYSEKD